MMMKNHETFCIIGETEDGMMKILFCYSIYMRKKLLLIKVRDFLTLEKSAKFHFCAGTLLADADWRPDAAENCAIICVGGDEPSKRRLTSIAGSVEVFLSFY